MTKKNERRISQNTNDSLQTHLIKKRKMPKLRATASLVLLIVLIIVAMIVFTRPRQSDPLIGTWAFDAFTQYSFDEHGQGELLVDDISYQYNYTISGETLSLDFAADIVRDCEYRYAIQGNTLTLVGGVNTAGGTYQLTRK